MTQDELKENLRQAGAYLEGHFALTSGKHSNAYVEKFQLLQFPRLCGEVCKSLASWFEADKPAVDVVVGPAVGGILLAYETARALHDRRKALGWAGPWDVRGIFLEREEGKLVLRRGFEIKPTDRVLVVEDVVTTGSSVFEVLEALKRERAEGRIVGVGFLVDRSSGKVNFGVPQKALMTLDLPAWDPVDCPLCKQGIPVTKRGSRKI
ncbi:MAG: orotate phosphoribosyltransferase [bacterium]